MNDNVLPIITIDGPSGSGKGTLSKKLARILKWHVLDSGIIYRALALIAVENKIDICNEEQLSILSSTIRINFINANNKLCVLLNGSKIKDSVYTEFIGNIASKIAIFPKVRENLCAYQRTFYMSPGLVADGRDMGTIVFPNAVLKIFLDASLQERVRRRLHQIQRKNVDIVGWIDPIFSKIIERDERDYHRKLAPLIPSVDSLVLDSTNLSAKEVMNKVLMYIRGFGIIDNNTI